MASGTKEPEKKSGGFNFKSLFVTQEDDAPASPPAAPPPGLRAPPVATIPVSYQAATPAVDEPMLARLMEQLASEAPKGYVVFLGNLQTLAEAIPTEELLYKAALKLASKQGQSVELLRLDFEKTVKMLEEQGRLFNEDAAKQVQAKVGARETEVARLKQEIVRLQAELGVIQVKLETETTAIAADTAKIETAKLKFAGAYAAAHSQIIDQQNKLTHYGK